MAKCRYCAPGAAYLRALLGSWARIYRATIAVTSGRLEEIVAVIARGYGGRFHRKPPQLTLPADRAQPIPRGSEAHRTWLVRYTRKPAGFDR